jgi:hypothetical protein
MNFLDKKYIAECIGTFALVSSVCGAALFSAPSAGLITVAIAIGAIVLAMAYAVGHISGGHFNPAVTCGLIAAGRFDAKDAIPYIIAQVVGGIAAARPFSTSSCPVRRPLRRPRSGMTSSPFQHLRRCRPFPADAGRVDRSRPDGIVPHRHRWRDVEEGAGGP